MRYSSGSELGASSRRFNNVLAKYEESEWWDIPVLGGIFDAIAGDANDHSDEFVLMATDAGAAAYRTLQDASRPQSERSAAQAVATRESRWVHIESGKVFDEGKGPTGGWLTLGGEEFLDSVNDLATYFGQGSGFTEEMAAKVGASVPLSGAGRPDPNFGVYDDSFSIVESQGSGGQVSSYDDFVRDNFDSFQSFDKSLKPLRPIVDAGKAYSKIAPRIGGDMAKEWLRGNNFEWSWLDKSRPLI